MAVFVAATAVVCVFAQVVDARNLTVLAWETATGGLFGQGVVGLFSIRIPLLVAALLASIGWARAARMLRPLPTSLKWLSAGTAVLAPVILVTWIAFT